MLDNLCCIPRNYVVRGENQLSGVALGIHTLQITINKYVNFKKKASFLSTWIFKENEVRQLNALRQRTPVFLERTQQVRPELQGWWCPTGYYFIPPLSCRNISDSHSEDLLSAAPQTCLSWLLPGSHSVWERPRSGDTPSLHLRNMSPCFVWAGRSSDTYI